MKYRGKRRKQSKKDRVFVAGIVMALVIVGGINILQLREKQAEYIMRKAELMEELEDEKQRKEDLADQKEYRQSKEYIEDIAKSKLGLVYKNEIIFRENN